MLQLCSQSDSNSVTSVQTVSELKIQMFKTILRVKTKAGTKGRRSSTSEVLTHPPPYPTTAALCVVESALHESS